MTENMIYVDHTNINKYLKNTAPYVFVDKAEIIPGKSGRGIKLFTNKLINCAGVAHVSMFSQTPISKIKEIFDINYFAQLEIIQLIMRKMTRQKFGNVINIGSVTGLITSEGQIPYSTSKLSLMQATKNLAAEYGRFNIKFNAVALGVVNTDMMKSLNDDEKKYFEDRTIMKRFCEPEEAAKVVRFLASDDASYINGQIIRVDGGLL